MKTETNVFPILNLSELTHQYRLFNIRGVKREDFQARQTIVKRLSRELKHPVLIVEREEGLKLVVKHNAEILAKVPEEYPLVGNSVYFSLSETVCDLDFTSADPETRKICLRFLQFDIQGELKNNPKLWQPGTGKPFFLKEPQYFGEVAMYPGFQVRVMPLSKGFGLVLDATVKFSRATPLPNYLKRNEFNKWYKGRTVIYRYGNTWYEVQPKEFDDLNVSEYKIEGEPLIEYIRNRVHKPHDHLLANLPKDASTLVYYKERKPSALPAGLCFEVFDFQDIQDARIKRRCIMPPFVRWDSILRDWRPFINSLRFGKTYLRIAKQPARWDLDKFYFPAFELGNNFILSPDDFYSPKDIADERLRRLLDKKTGFHTSTPFHNHFIALPRSIFDSMGSTFVQMLSNVVNDMYPSDEYRPEIIPYEDKFRLGTDYVAIGRSIIEAIDSSYSQAKPGYGLVMIPRFEKKKKKDHDKLSALIIRELEKRNFKCSTIHTDMTKECLTEGKDREGKVFFKVLREKSGKFNGYLKNVAINKVLLTCQKYPFVLDTPLSADLTIGIDVKHNTAGFVIIDKYAKSIKPELDTTSNKERLSAKQLKSWIYKIVRDYLADNPGYEIKNIVIHRDGRVFETEIEGMVEGLVKLKEDHILTSESTISIIEIHKTSFLPLRLFGLTLDRREQIVNPEIGTYYLHEDDAFICTTGKEFRHDGTTNPLYVKFCQAHMPKKEILHDLFKLSTLAFTKPDDCSRYPLSLKINDLRLSDAASEYEEDEFNHDWEIPIEEPNLN